MASCVRSFMRTFRRNVPTFSARGDQFSPSFDPTGARPTKSGGAGAGLLILNCGTRDLFTQELSQFSIHCPH
jgi:hypothetical protein